MNYKQKGFGIICMKWLHVTLVFNVSLSKNVLDLFIYFINSAPKADANEGSAGRSPSSLRNDISPGCLLASG